MNRSFTVLFQKESEGGYTVSVPELPGCVTHGDTLEEAKEMVIDAINLYLESLQEKGESLPIALEDFLISQVNVDIKAVK